MEYDPSYAIEKTKWKMMVEIEKSIKKNGGHIFGGYVRDKILHDHHADHFYEHISKENCTHEFMRANYNNKSYLPECADRCTLPVDIDCFMTTKQLKQFMEHVRKNNFKIMVKKTQQASFYMPVSNPNREALNHMFHTKLTVMFRIHRLLMDVMAVDQFKVDVDVIHTINDQIDMFDTLTSNFDFECNSLLLTPHDEFKLSVCVGKYLSPSQKLNKIQSIISDIHSKKAVSMPHNNIPGYRYTNILKKGWNIIAPSFEINLMKEADDGHCLICHCGFSKGINYVKCRTCTAAFHPKCFSDLTTHDNFKNECPMCRKQCHVDSNELQALGSIAWTQE